MSVRRWAAVAATSTLLLSGCSSTSSASGDAGSDPIKVMNIEALSGTFAVDNTAADGARAAAGAVNAAGGVNGREIEVISCDSASDPNQAQKCVRDAAEEGVVAIVGAFDVAGQTAGIETAEAMGIPWVAPTTMTEQELVSPVSFVVTAGAQGVSYGTAAVAVELDCTVYGTWLDPAAGPDLTDTSFAALENAGIKTVSADIPVGTADVTPAVQQVLAGDPDCIGYSGANTVAVQAFTAVRRAGSDAQFISAVQTVFPGLLPNLGDIAEGLIAISDVPLASSEELAGFRSDLESYTELDPKEATGMAVVAWYGTLLVAQAAEGLSEVTADSLLTSLGELSSVELPGLPEIDFSTDLDNARFPRLFNPNIMLVRAEGGSYVADGDSWIDITEYLPSS